MSEIFSDLDEGRLMSLQIDPKTRFIFRIWFDYTRNLFNEIKEGDFLAVEAFEQDTDGGTKYSILKITQKIPHHYALPEGLKGYPGFTQEAARSVAESFITQQDASDEELTKIQCEAVPTGRILILRTDEPSIDTDRSIPLIGGDAKILHQNMLFTMINYDILKQSDPPVCAIGTHIGHENVEILLDPIQTMNKHFGVFGFTGAGKSNLLSTFIAYSLTKQKKENVKIVLLDMNDEYTALLIDVLSNPEVDTYIVARGEQALPGSVRHYYENDSASNLERATTAILKQLLLPMALIEHEEKFRNPIITLLKRKAFKEYRDVEERRVNQVLTGCKNEINPSGNIWRIIEDAFESVWYQTATAELTRDIISSLERARSIQESSRPEGQADQVGPIQSSLEALETEPLVEEEDTTERAEAPGETGSGNSTRQIFEISLSTPPQKQYARRFARCLRTHQAEVERGGHPGTISMSEIQSILNTDDKHTLIIVVAHNNDLLRILASDIGNNLYRRRRTNPQKYPQVSLIFDEADEFIPQTLPKDNASYRASRAVVEMIARRGRKYRIGVGISTQRIVYLHTNVMAQMQTYFVSRLPRATDRDRISEAFMLSEHEFGQTHTFEIGEWLLVSHHGAVGLRNVPIPVRLQDANERVKEFLNPNPDS